MFEVWTPLRISDIVEVDKNVWAQKRTPRKFGENMDLNHTIALVIQQFMFITIYQTLIWVLDMALANTGCVGFNIDRFLLDLFWIWLICIPKFGDNIWNKNYLNWEFRQPFEVDFFFHKFWLNLGHESRRFIRISENYLVLKLRPLAGNGLTSTLT